MNIAWVGTMSITVSVRTAAGMVERHPVCRAPAAVVADAWKRAKAEALHQPDLIARHRAEGVVRVVGQAGGLRRVAVAAQVGADDRVPPGELRRDARPHRHALRKPVQQQHRRPVAADRAGDADAIDVDDPALEFLEHVRILRR